jgi:SAM-dependent methyltransferase
VTKDYASTRHFEQIVTDRIIEEPWAVSSVRPGERVLDVGSATSRYLRDLPPTCRVYALDLRPTPPQPGLGIVQGDVLLAPFAAGSFDVITCISTIEHVGLDVYGQRHDVFGDEVAMRHLRKLLRPGGRLLLSAPFGRRTVSAWLRVYDRPSFARISRGFRVLSRRFYRRDGESFVACEAGELSDKGFDFEGMRSNGLLLAELTPTSGPSFWLARASLRARRLWRRLARRRGPWWADPWSGEPAKAWLERHDPTGRE